MSHDEQNVRTESLPIACTLSAAGEVAERRATIEELFADVVEKHELPDGYEFVFPGDDNHARRLFQFVEAERKCCPFLSFELAFEHARGPVHLRLRGAVGVKDFLNEWMKDPS